MILFNVTFEHAFTWVTGKQPPDQLIVPELKKAFADAPWLTGLAVCLLAPVSEEILFRGLFYAALAKWLKTEWVIVLTAAIFASVHLQGFYFLPLFVAGMVLGWARQRTGSLTAPMLIHCLNNLFTLAALHFGK